MMPSNDMFISWTFPQLLGMVAMIFLCVVLGFSRKSPITENIGVILSAHFVVIHTIVWNAFMMTTVWNRGDTVLRFEGTPSLAAIVFCGGLLFPALLLGCSIAFFSKRRNYSPIQKLFYWVSAALVMLGLVGTLWTPTAFQRHLDAL